MRMIIYLMLLATLFGCKEESKKTPSPLQTKELIVVTHNSPTTYFYKGENEMAGLEYDLVNLFVKELGPEYQVKFVLADNIASVLPMLLEGKAHMAAGDLSMTDGRKKLVYFSQSYQDVQQVVVYNTELNNKPLSIDDLVGKQVVVAAGSSYAERLAQLKKTKPALQWHEAKNVSTDELMEKVANGQLDFTIADSHLISILQNYYPNLATGLNVGKPEQVAWAFPKNGDPILIKRANQFFDHIRQDGTLRNLIDRYYGHVERLNPEDVTTFLKRTRTILPRYLKLFKQAQDQTGLDWRLLAAISYQESNWDPYNTSPTNVRGMMMLTEETADKLGVTDRLDAKQSILAGAKYTLILKDIIPENVPEPDRTWMALAAYNIGFAHFQDARELARRLHLNPDTWADLKITLPLLNKAEFYKNLKFGYASGGAPVIFVESIRTYYNILDKYQPVHTNTFQEYSYIEKPSGNGLTQ